MTSSGNVTNATILDRIRNLSPEQRLLLEKSLASRTTGPASQPIARRAPGDPNPLSFGQQRLWFMNRLQPELSNYNKSAVVRLKGPLNLSALKNAFQAIFTRHEVLRTTYSQSDETPVQSLHADFRFDLPVCNLSQTAGLDREREVRRLIEAEASRPFDLTGDVPLRALLLICGDGDHVLITTLHHIAMDAWSRSNLWIELSRHYEAFMAGEESSLPDLPIQYSDFAFWQRKMASAPQMAKQLEYWTSRLAGLPPIIELPADRSRPPVPSGRGGRLRFELSDSLERSLRQLARTERATLFMVLLSAFQTLLFRYTGQSDIAVGTPMSGRTRVSTEPLIGYLVNTLVMRTDVSGNPSFRELLRRVREGSTEAFAHQDVPYDRLVEVLAPERSLSHQPLVQVTFSLKNTPSRPIQFAGLSTEWIEVNHVAAKFDLWFELAETPGGLKGKIEYNLDLFDPETIERMLGHYRILLESVVADPDQPIELISLLSPPERLQIVDEWNETSRDVVGPATLHELFERQVERTPGAVAVECHGQKLTYRELNARANQLARCLQLRGVRPDRLVGICMKRTPDLIAGILGILKAGGAYLPLDIDYPQDRLAFMIEDSAAAVLVTQKDLQGKLPSHQLQVICLDTDLPAIQEFTQENLHSTVGSNDLAYLLFTSGSTGKPKGVAIEHRSVVAFLNWACDLFSPEDLKGVLASTSICFDLSVFEIFAPLCCGGTVILAQNALELPWLAASQDVTLLNTVPSAIAELLAQRGVPSNIRTITMGGEFLPQHLVGEIYAKTNARRVFDLYGPTESTVYSTWALRTPEGEATIGRPIHNTRIYILDPHRQPVPIGIAGELHIGGDGLARGYLNRPDLTAERFIPNPFGSPGSRMYKTGDRARYRPDGQIEYLGRFDHQIKLRGFRIELGEVEAVLRQSGQIRDLAVTLREVEAGDERLVAYVVMNTGCEFSAAVLRQVAQKSLPDYMIPTAFVALPQLPLTPNGKLNRQALPLPDHRESSAEYTAPRDALELQLARIWENVLNVQPIGIQDDFFELGGHSLLAVRLFDRMERVTGHPLPLTILFECPTIDHLATALRKSDWMPRWKSLTPIRPGGSKRPLFLVPPAAGSVFRFAELAEQLGPDRPVYGLEPLGRSGDTAPQQSVEEMATFYLSEIRDLQPQGPYLLGGICFGGHVAWEMACQLREQGEEVELVLLDSTAPENGPDWSRTSSTVAAVMRRLATNRSTGHIMEFVLEAVRWRWRRISRQLRKSDRRELRLDDAHNSARYRYRARPFGGPVLCLQSSQLARDPINRERWMSLSGGAMNCVVLPGTRHRDLLLGTHFTPMLARIIREYLECPGSAETAGCFSLPTGQKSHPTRRAA